MLSGVVAPSSAHDHHDDQGVARDLYERGEIGPLAEILKHVHHGHPGDIVAVDLVQVDGKWFYRFQMVGPDGRRSVLDIAADTDAEGPNDPEGGQ